MYMYIVSFKNNNFYDNNRTCFVPRTTHVQYYVQRISYINITYILMFIPSTFIHRKRKPTLTCLFLALMAFLVRLHLPICCSRVLTCISRQLPCFISQSSYCCCCLSSSGVNSPDIKWDCQKGFSESSKQFSA